MVSGSEVFLDFLSAGCCLPDAVPGPTTHSGLLKKLYALSTTGAWIGSRHVGDHMGDDDRSFRGGLERNVGRIGVHIDRGGERVDQLWS